ncbi:inositol-1-monophosphatase ImpA [Longimycelium tulufanense]|uniref:inositol-phosphate phosphatase n=1 Tax=Longimycelium tulufanense TaxID=907463 RepID=A0A8J3C7T1_9PSEU|nr:inositol monophosphatase [Longimycelium tulufanense]GGM37350.1 inositol-1-monophosphatase ImpA [Longimycelium tulufanense]
MVVADPADHRLGELADIAATVLDEAVPDFVRWLGAASEVEKSPGDFATAADFAIEERVARLLTQRTGIAVHGEEHGGPDPAQGEAWVLDPIDGTANYSTRLPLTGMLLALLRDGAPVAGLTWLPLLDQRWTAVGGELRCNGHRQPPLAGAKLAESAVTFGNPRRVRSTEDYPTRWRFDVLEAITARCLRVRMLGSTGVELAFVAGGVCGGALGFSDRPWDNAAGVCMIRAVGGIATDLEGRPWTVDRPVLAGAPGVHGELLEIVRSVGDPAAFGDD